VIFTLINFPNGISIAPLKFFYYTSVQFSIYLYSVHRSLRALWPPVFSHWVKPSRGQAWGPMGEKIEYG